MSCTRNRRRILPPCMLLILAVVRCVWPDTIPGIKGYRQQLDRWCWAAICETIVKFYDRGNTKTQRQIAGVLTAMNMAVHPDSIPRCLTENGKAADLQVEYIKDSLSWPELKKEADEMHPCYLLISWDNGQTPTNYHSNLICGYLQDSLHIKVYDPGNDYFSIRRWGNLSLNGQWWRTYKTKAKMVKIILNTASSAHAGNDLRMIRNHMRGITFLFNGNSGGSKVLTVYNALGTSIYESFLEGNETQSSWSDAASASTGMYVVSLESKTASGLRNVKRKTFYVMK